MVDNWVVYLVQCDDETFYCGISNRPAQRFATHQSGKGARYTRMHGAKEMRIIACCLNQSSALKMEYAVKKRTRSEKQLLWQNAQKLFEKS